MALLASVVRLLQGAGLTNVGAFNTNGLLILRLESIVDGSVKLT
jgi:hypothetical protein